MIVVIILSTIYLIGVAMEPHQKLRLKVSTNTGLNIMCTTNKEWTVEQLYSHLNRLYKEVTEDQSGEHVSVQITTLKRHNFYIPKSQVVGEIFVDGDEVTCSVETKFIHASNKAARANKETSKKDKIKEKAQEKAKEKAQQKLEAKDSGQKLAKNTKKQIENKKKQVKKVEESDSEENKNSSNLKKEKKSKQKANNKSEKQKGDSDDNNGKSQEKKEKIKEKKQKKRQNKKAQSDSVPKMKKEKQNIPDEQILNFLNPSHKKEQASKEGPVEQLKEESQDQN